MYSQQEIGGPYGGSGGAGNPRLISPQQQGSARSGYDGYSFGNLVMSFA